MKESDSVSLLCVEQDSSTTSQNKLLRESELPALVRLISSPGSDYSATTGVVFNLTWLKHCISEEQKEERVARPRLTGLVRMSPETIAQAEELRRKRDQDFYDQGLTPPRSLFEWITLCRDIVGLTDDEVLNLPIPRLQHLILSWADREAIIAFNQQRLVSKARATTSGTLGLDPPKTDAMLRKGTSNKRIQRDLEIEARWKRAKEAQVSRSTFCSDEGISLSELKKLCARCRMRRHRANKGTRKP